MSECNVAEGVGIDPSDIEHLAQAIHEGYRRTCEHVVVPTWDEAGESLRETRRRHAQVVLYLERFSEIPEQSQCLADQIVDPDVLEESRPKAESEAPSMDQPPRFLSETNDEAAERIAERLVDEGRVVQGKTDGESWYLVAGDVPVPFGMVKISLDALFRRLAEASE